MQHIEDMVAARTTRGPKRELLLEHENIRKTNADTVRDKRLS